jgi:minor extracellular serine protease Vpr
MRRRLRLGTLVVLAGLGVAAFAVASRSHSSQPLRADAGTAAEWRGLVGSPRPPVGAAQRVLVVLRAPSLASQVAAAGGVASDTDERRFTSVALAAQQQLVSALVAKGVAVRPRFRYTRLLNGFSAEVDAHSLSLIERARSVQGVFPVRAAYPAVLKPGHPDLLARGLGVRPDLSLGGFDGSGVTIALLDTGVDAPTPFLHGRILDGVDILDPGADPVPRKSPVAPHALERHGTEMAGLLVGAGGPGGLSGIAPGASVLPVRVAGWQRDAIGRYAIYARTDQILAGLERAVDPNADGDAHDGARVALVPLAQPFAAFTDDPLAQAAAGALGLDMLVVAPAGNDGPAGPAFGSLSGPGGGPAVLTVGAADLKPMAATEQLLVRDGLRVLFNRPVALAGAWGSKRRLELEVVAPRRLVDRRGFSSVAGRAALLPATSSPSQIAAEASAAGARAVLMRGGGVPPGSLGVGEGLPVPVVPVSDELARAVRDALARGEHVTAVLGPIRLRPTAVAETVAPFSSRGFDFAAGFKPDLVAPGVTVTTADPAAGASGSPFVTISGSSAAAAVAAGAAAVLLQARPALDAAALKSVLVGSARRVHGAGVQAQGAGRIDLLAGAGVEVATQPAEVSFGRAPEKGWRRSQTITVRNLSPRALAVYTSAEQGAHPEVALDVSPARLLLSPGGSDTLTVRAAPAGVVRPGVATGKVVLTPVGGEPLRVPWAVVVAPPPGRLLASVRLTRKRLTASTSAQAVLSLRAGSVVHRRGGDEIRPVRRLDLVLEDEKGKPIGLLVRLRDLLPGRYSFGVTARDPDGFALDPGRYVIQLIAWPTAPGEPTAVSVSFEVPGSG